jgi:molybdopterin adenylyltransferase
MRIAVLTVSDAGARGERADSSGDAAVQWSEAQGAAVVARALVPDDTLAIVRTLLAWCDDDMADLVLTTGGTGLSPRDVTPEATRAVIEREAEGIAERLRVVTGGSFPRAALSRGLCGVRHRTLIVNLPGSTSGVRETLAAFTPIAKHAVDILRGTPTEHSDGDPTVHGSRFTVHEQ